MNAPPPQDREPSNGPPSSEQPDRVPARAPVAGSAEGRPATGEVPPGAHPAVPHPAHARRRLSLWGQFLTLLGLRFRLGSRIFFGSGIRVFAFFITLVLFVPLSFFLAFFAALWAAAGIPNIANYAFLGVFMYVLIANVFGVFGNEFMDTSKLLVYPVSPILVFTASVVGNLFAPFFLFSLPSLIGITIGMGGSASEFVIRILLLALFWFMTVMSSQVVGLISVNMLKTRRFQDLVRVIAPLGGLFLYIGIQVVLQGGEEFKAAASFFEHFPWPLKVLPPYWISSIFTDFAGGNYLLIAAGLGGTIYAIAILFLLGGWFQNRAFHGEIAAVGAPKPATGAEEDLPRGTPSLLSRVIPDPVLAVAHKEFLLYRREPGFKTIIIQQAAFVVLILVMEWVGHRGGEFFFTRASALFFFTGFLLYMESTLLLNQFGPEGTGLEFLFLHPTDRRRILLGKNLAGMVFFGSINTVFIIVLGLLTSAGFGRIALAWILQLGALIIVTGFGNWASVLLAWPMFVRGKSAAAQMRTERLGCVRPIISLGALLALSVLMAPLIVLAYWSEGRIGPGRFVPLLGITVGYAMILYNVFLAIGAAVLRMREQTLIEAFTKSPD